MNRRTFSACLVLAILSATLACTVFRSGPASTVKEFYDKVASGEIDGALNLLSGQFRTQFGDQKLRAALTEQARQIKQQKGGVKSIETKSEDIQGELATVTVLITYTNGSTQTDTTHLVKESGYWRITPSK